MAKAPEQAKALTLRDLTGAPKDDQTAEYQKLLATNYGWQDGPREQRDNDGNTTTVEFGAPHEHIAKTLLGVALRDLRTAVSNSRINEAREKIAAQVAAEIPEA